MPTSWVALAVALLAIVPGFLATTTWARNRTWRGPANDLRTVLQSLALSGVIQVLVAPLTQIWIVPVRHRLEHHAGRTAVWFLLTVLVIPVLLGLVSARLTDAIFNPRRQREYGPVVQALVWFFRAPWPPSVWDWTFTTEVADGRFVLAEFTDGSRVGGVFAKGSIAVTTPDVQGVFLVEEWRLDEAGDFVDPVPGSRGILIPRTDDIRWVRVLASADEPAPTTEGR
jgi:hypothetical protein